MLASAQQAAERLGLNARNLAPLSDQRNAHWNVELAAAHVVLRRYREDRSLEEARYENELLEFLAARGWPVPRAVTELQLIDGHVWCAFERLPGREPSRTPETRRETGRLIARLHVDLQDSRGLGQRPTWLTRAEIFELDPPLETALARLATKLPEETPILMRYATRARAAYERTGPPPSEPFPIHFDVTPWNLLYDGDRLTGLLDFELSHLDHRVADLVLSWRGSHEEVIAGFEEVSELDDHERALLAPFYWVSLLEIAYRAALRGDSPDLSWVMGHLGRESDFTRMHA